MLTRREKLVRTFSWVAVKEDWKNASQLKESDYCSVCLGKVKKRSSADSWNMARIFLAIALFFIIQQIAGWLF